MLLGETPSVRTPTLKDIALENRKRLESMGVKSNNRTACQSLLQMMSCLGELSNFTYHNETLSPFEQREVRGVVGRMIVCLATFGEVFDIDVGQAGMDTILEQTRKATTTTTTTALARPKNELRKTTSLQVAVDVRNDGDDCSHLPKGGPHVLLSPTSNRDFFGYLDELITYSQKDFEKAELKWVAPLPDGTIQELIENGSHVNVEYADLSKYLESVEPYRNARANETQCNRPHVDALDSAPSHRTKSAAVPLSSVNLMPERDLSMFSPSLANEVAMSPNSQAFPAAPGDAAGVLEAEFNAKVDSVRRGLVTGAEVAQLNLSFGVPHNGKFVELIPNGSHVRVTAANVAEFLRLVGDKAAIQSGKVRRLESLKKLEVSGAGSIDLSKEKDKFSPTHFSKNIFAPYEERTSFLVDCDASDKILPVYIKELDQQQQRRSESYYVRVVRQGDLKGWRTIIEEVQKDPSALNKYGVTFCVPTAVVPDATEEEQLTKIHELMKGGITTLVGESHLWLFSRMIEQYLQAPV